MNIGTTDIDALPISPQSGSGSNHNPSNPSNHHNPSNHNPSNHNPSNQQQQNNVRFDLIEKPPQYNPNIANVNNISDIKNVVTDNAAQTLQQQRSDDPAVLQRNMNQFVTGLQQASASGLTSLSARDIPQSQEHLARDQQVQPNYIPQAPTDYINEQASLANIIQNQGFKETQSQRVNDWYDELQVPILLAVLYFLFQLPAVRLRMLAFMPSLFQKDGNPNLTGYVINSIFFGGLYLALKHGMQYFAL